MNPDKYLKADFLDILFEGKNKDYGAYELRKHYNRRVRNAIIFTTLISLLLAGAYTARVYLTKESLVKQKPETAEVRIESIKIPAANQPPPPPPPPPQALEPPRIKPQVQFTPPKVVKDQEVKPDEQLPDLDKIKNQAISTVTKSGDPNGIDPGLVADKGSGVVFVPSTPSVENKVFTWVEQMPRFPGSTSDEDSQNKILKYLQDHIQYPAMARDNGIQGTVYVQFIVDPDGNIKEVKTVNSRLGGGLEAESIQVISGMPKWIPGKQNGRPVTVQFSIPVKFLLQ